MNTSHWLTYLNELTVGSLLFLLWIWLTLADHIRRIRGERGWNQIEFGEQLGVDERTIRRWEQGQSPSVRFAYKIAKLDKSDEFISEWEFLEMVRMFEKQGMKLPIQRISKGFDIDMVATTSGGLRIFGECKSSEPIQVNGRISRGGFNA